MYSRGAFSSRVASTHVQLPTSWFSYTESIRMSFGLTLYLSSFLKAMSAILHHRYHVLNLTFSKVVWSNWPDRCYSLPTHRLHQPRQALYLSALRHPRLLCVSFAYAEVRILYLEEVIEWKISYPPWNQLIVLSTCLESLFVARVVENPLPKTAWPRNLFCL